MSTDIIHKVINKDGCRIIMPQYKGGQEGWGNLVLPNPYICDQVQQYPTGTKLIMGYRTFIYTYLQVASSGFTVANATGLGVISENVPFDVTVVTATAGAYEVSATVSTVTANQFAGGFLNFYESGYSPQTSIVRIESHTAGTSVTFTLSDPLLTTYSTSATCRAIQDPYSNVRFPASNRTSSACFEPLMGIWVAGEDKDGTAAAEGDYAWVQTWGPCFCWASISYEGGTTREREAFHFGGGGIQVNTSSDSYPPAQRVGFLLPSTCSDPGVSTTGSDCDQMEHVIWLQIQP